MADVRRFPALDVMRGFCIILVVFQHQYRGLVSASLVEADTLFRFIDAFIYLFHVPAFFLISGVLASLKDGQAEKPSAFTRLVTELFYPYLFWSVLQSALMIAASGLANRARGWGDLVWIFLYPMDQFWFLYAFFFVALVETFAFKKTPSPKRRAFLALAGLALWLGSAALNTPWSPLEQIGYGLFYFMIGGLVRSVFDLHKKVKGRDIGLVLICLAVVTGFALFCIAYGFSTIWMIPAALAGSWILWVLSCLLSDVYTLGMIGRNSFAIFAVHTIAGAAFRIGLAKGLNITHLGLHLVAGSAFAIMLPLIAVYVLTQLRLPSRLVGLPAWK
jgi:fucose 4-O-acetylase-like acetyltransferase